MLKIITLERSILGLRIALGVTFLWFGALKLFGYNPVFDIVYASFPFLAEGVGNIALAAFEMIIGLGLILNLLPWLIDIALIGHLIGTLSVFITGPEVVFDPYFPVLSLAGEFVFKNVILLMAGFVVLRYNESRAETKK